MPDSTAFSPGSLIHARGRDWVVEPDSKPDFLHLRPLAGTADESAWIVTALEREPPVTANFPLPDPERRGNWSEMRLLQDAMLMRLRSGAGPFRSFGNIAVEPRVYQLVPLMMALRQDVTRLLIADDVGVGKTIEAGLIVRELMDRGEVARFSVLCPPSLVDQWQEELQRRFNIRSTAVTSSTVKNLERLVPPGRSFFDHFPVTIISLDYIKSDAHRHSFLSAAPECLIVDEAHTCTSVGRAVQQRFRLLKELAADHNRHLILLTATPHSGIDSGFYNLLGLLNPEFTALQDTGQQQRKALRERLARYLLQRKRADITKWQQDQSLFPTRLSSEATYQLTGAWGAFFDEVQDYCIKMAESHRDNRMIWYATLALLRCISSSPASAVSALNERLNGVPATDEEQAITSELTGDEGDDEIAADRETPALADAGEESVLRGLMAKAQSLYGPQNDPKLKALIAGLKPLIQDGFSPIIFCQFISTANYVGQYLRKAFKTHHVQVVTGNLAPSEREEAVAALIADPRRILVATNCLSEGINLQKGFNAVVHYDLAWNPSRHEQREGRVDRYGQASPTVKCLMLYGLDNPVDGFILKVILRKAKAIQDQLGIKVPIPENEKAITDALIRAALLKRRDSHSKAEQLMLDGFEEVDEMMDKAWKAATERAARTIFAQQPMRPEDVEPEFRRQQELIGSTKDLQRFMISAAAFLGAPLEPDNNSTWTINIANLPATLRTRLEEHKLSGKIRFSFQPGSNVLELTRTHPLTSGLADYIAEHALDRDEFGRAAVVKVASGIMEKTTIFSLRLRYCLTYTFNQKTHDLMAEELLTLIRTGSGPLHIATAEEKKFMREIKPGGNIVDAAAQRFVNAALDEWKDDISTFAALVHERAEVLKSDYDRIRAAARQKAGFVSVKALMPPDLLSVCILMPAL